MALIANKYEVIRRLGQGAFGIVVLAKHLDLGIPYAIKILKKIE